MDGRSGSCRLICGVTREVNREAGVVGRIPEGPQSIREEPFDRARRKHCRTALAPVLAMAFNGDVMDTRQPDTRIEIPESARRAARVFGYSLAVAINVVLLVIVQNVQDWGWFGFLTPDFAEVEPLISLALLVTILANVVYAFDDGPLVKSVGQMLTNLLNLYVSLQVLAVFPFDFSEHAFDWALVVRIVLIIGVVGAGIGALVEVNRLLFGRAIGNRR